MEMSPQQVRNASFKSAKRGFDPDEVQAFLRDVAESLEAAQNQSTAMEARARAAVARLQEVSTARETPAAPVSAGDAETISRTLLLAQRTADATVSEAKTEADRIVTAAHEEAATTIDSTARCRRACSKRRAPRPDRCPRSSSRPPRARSRRCSPGATSSSRTSTNSSTSSSINATGCARPRRPCSTSPNVCQAGSAMFDGPSCRRPMIPRRRSTRLPAPTRRPRALIRRLCRPPNHRWPRRRHGPTRSTIVSEHGQSAPSEPADEAPAVTTPWAGEPEDEPQFRFGLGETRRNE